MSILVTGASGFIGLNIVEALLARGEEVIATSREPIPAAAARAFQALPGQLSECIADVSLDRQIGDVVASRRPVRIIHAAALTLGPRTELDLAAAAFTTNVGGTANVLCAAHRAGVARTVLLSSASVYGDNAYGGPLDEESTAPAPRTVYAISKFAAERVALRFREITGVDVAIVRLSAAFGPWERDTGVRETLSPFFQTLRLAQAGAEAIVDRLCHRDWIYSREAAAGVLAVTAFDGGSPILNLGPGMITPFDVWLDCLQAHVPGFRWRIGARDEANVELHGDRDRSPLAIDRIQGLGWTPRRTPVAAFSDYLEWNALHEKEGNR